MPARQDPPDPPITSADRARSELLRPQGDSGKAQTWALLALIDSTDAQTDAIRELTAVLGPVAILDSLEGSMPLGWHTPDPAAG